MNPLKLTRKLLPAALIEAEIEQIRTVVLENINPINLYLFGSSAENKMTDQSDFDLLFVLSSVEEIKIAQIQWRKIRPLLPKRAFDVVWLTQSGFERKKREGGVAMIAYEDGRKLI